jgi:hypothetical protein
MAELTAIILTSASIAIIWQISASVKVIISTLSASVLLTERAALPLTHTVSVVAVHHTQLPLIPPSKGRSSSLKSVP